MINVSFNGKKMFDWQGDTDAVALMEEQMNQIAKEDNVTAAALAHTMLASIEHNGDFISSKPETQQAEMMFATWALLTMPTTSRPGLVRDYIEMWDFDIDISRDPADENKLSIALDAKLAAAGSA